MKKFLSAFLLLISYAFGENLIDLAKNSGLVGLPKDQNALDKLISEHAVDYKKYPTTKEQVELGKMLYFDPRLSKSELISCNTCHNIGLAGTDGLETAIGDKWNSNPHHLNSPTTFNAVFNQTQFWDGRDEGLAKQAMGPMLSLPEMASTKDLIETRLNSMPEYKELFAKAYKDDGNITFDKVAISIGIFERTLITRSKFDDFLDGDEKALSDEQKAGLKLFIDKGCVTCHNGVNLGGTMRGWQLVEKYKFDNIGDFKGNKDGLVKVPTLRNVLLTAPYYHNGAVWSIIDAIKMMGSIQLGTQINDEEAQKIKAFFTSLTGEQPKIIYPILPPVSSNTPKPIVK